MHITAWAGLLFMSFFTALTLYIAIANPVSDCGCFGDAIKLSNWGTFYKNIFLIALAIVVFWQRKAYSPLFRENIEWGIIGFYFALIIAVFIYCLNHLPVLDFRPYHVGAVIKAGMTVPEGAPLSEYKTTFLYKKDGVIKEFTTDNYPWNDSTWVWVETRQELVKKGFEPLIHDFSITSGDGLDLTDSILTSPGYTFLLISTELRNADKDGILKASTLAEESAKHGYGLYCLTARACGRPGHGRRPAGGRRRPRLPAGRRARVLHDVSACGTPLEARRMRLLLHAALDALDEADDAEIEDHEEPAQEHRETKAA
jgi:hypothetical protein